MTIKLLEVLGFNPCHDGTMYLSEILDMDLWKNKYLSACEVIAFKHGLKESNVHVKIRYAIEESWKYGEESKWERIGFDYKPSPKQLIRKLGVSLMSRSVDEIINDLFS